MNRTETRRVLAVCGSCISFYIGAGFSTMQELVQYEASYGSRFPLVIAVTALIYVYTNLSFAANGHRLQLTRGGDIYRVYGSVLGERAGIWIGKFFDLFSALFCYMSFVVMCGGASATASQQWGVPAGLGAGVLAALAIATVVFGLNGIVKALSRVGPVIIAMILFVSLVTTCTGYPSLKEGMAQVDAGRYSQAMAQVGGGNPIASGASYGGFVILWFAAFIAEIGSKNDLRSVRSGMLLSTLCIFGAAALCCTAILGHIDATAASDIPALVLAGQISPVIAQVFAIVICAGIYTSAVPLLWTGVRAITQEGSVHYRPVTAILGILGCLIACLVPYKGLINILYGLNGYLGFLLVFLMIVHDLNKSHDSNSCRKRAG